MSFAPVLVLLTLPAQTTPSFAGRWAGGRAMANLAGVVGPQEITISQDASVLTIERLFSRNRVSISIKSKATWEGSKLKIATVYKVTDGRSGAKHDVVTIETLSLKGGDLIVERSDEAMGVDLSRGPVRGGMIQTRTDTYKKVLEP